MMKAFEKKYAPKTENVAIDLAPKKCRNFKQCGNKFLRQQFHDHTEYCDICKKINNSLRSKRNADLKFIRWIPDYLKEKIPDIEEADIIEKS